MKNHQLFICKLLFLLCVFVSSVHARETGTAFGYVDNNGVKLHYATMGEGTLVVMLHGFPDYWYTWREQMAVLSKNFQVVAMDLRGYNKSDKPAGVENYAMRHLIGDVAAVIQYFPQKKAVLVGHDWGGAIAWQVAMWRPDLVEKLVVLSTPHPLGLFREINNNQDQQKNSQYARDFQAEDAHKDLSAEGLADWVKDESARAKYIEAFKRSDFEAMLNYYKASFPRQSSNSSTPASAAPPRRVKSSTLAIFGLEDKALLPAGWNSTWEWIDADLTLVSVPDAGHFVQQDAADFVSQTIAKWLENGNAAAPSKNFIAPLTRPNPNAPPETAQLAPLVGTWEAVRFIRRRDGSWSSPVKALWQWYYILDGHAIQDDWGLLDDSTGALQTIGTNLRIYNPTKKHWEMTWIDKSARSVLFFKATEVDGKVIMNGKNAKGQQVRNTFSDITPASFLWQQEWTMDGGNSWFVVVKIECRRRS